MIDVDEYNAAGTKLLEALNAAESDFTWSYRDVCYEKQEEDVAERDLSFFDIRAMTKKRYAKGRLFMDQRISRHLIDDNEIDIVSLLIAAANTSAAEKLREENDNRTEGPGDSV